MNRLAALTLLALPVTPIAAQSAASVWEVGRSGRDLCIAGRTLDAAGGGYVALGLGTDGRVALIIDRRGRAAPGSVQRLAFGLDGQQFEGGESVSASDGLVTLMPAEFLDGFATASELRVLDVNGATLRTLPLAGSGAAARRLRERIDALRGDAPSARLAEAAPPAPEPAVLRREGGRAAPPAPVGSKASWLAGLEYPASALRNDEQGTVRVRLSVDPNGRVDDCSVILSSGSNSLDAETCRIFQRRARFRPATDADGRPVSGSNEQSISWRLPG
ncbi:MAG: hypothetical protein AVDCRST_MAG39-757 [uncultured Sphingomonadaceae bacterium]|uniref:TonB C-terminal domain-containing protein n=1 Tax=uncultured Sphingomonadaceae bacterium TaxID=169976 RepID=A0A6J4SCT5_9SPHN|nr:MAG: hypothetical protein AVDCRST_MAG39-757 [uncultured Sphingomonadaceae bacterium]